jgi:hypothetical protein
MAIVGLNEDESFEGELNKGIELYKDILKDINNKVMFDNHYHLFEKKLDKLKICMVNLLIMQGLDDPELNKREIYIDKFISVLDIVKALEHVYVQG